MNTWIEKIKSLFLSLLCEQHGSCAVCKKVLFFEKGPLCSSCERKLLLQAGRHDRCVLCGREITEQTQGHMCAACAAGTFYGLLSGCESLYPYTRFSRGVVHAIKYEANLTLGEKVGEVLAHRLKKLSYDKKIDIIIPVPLHEQRLKERGFNQSDLFASQIARVLEKPFLPQGLVRCKNTEDQTKLNASQRRENVKEAFVCAEGLSLKDKRILVVDDVITTGATIEACARALKEAGAGAVFAASIASTSAPQIKRK